MVFTDAKRSSNPFTLSSVKKDTLSLVVATGVVLSDALMGGRSNMSRVSMIYYYPITCLGDRGPNLQDHLLRSGSRPVQKTETSPSLRSSLQARLLWTVGERALRYILSPIQGVYPLHPSVATAGE